MKRISTCITNLLAKWIWLASTVVLIFTLNSCKKPDNFGFEDDSLGSGYVDTLTVNVSTYLLEDAGSDGLAYLIMGSYEDPDAGKVGARTYTQLRLDGDGTDIPKDAQFESASLKLVENVSYYNNVNESYQLKYAMYPLLDSIYKDVDYTVSDSIDYAKTDMLSESDRTQIDGVYGKQIFDALKGGASQSEFDSLFPGVAFEGYADITTAVVRYPLTSDLDTSLNYIEINYSYGDTTSKGEDTTIYSSYTLLIDQFCKHFTQYWADRSGTDFASLEPGGTLWNDTVMFQTGTGLRMRMRFPTIKEHFDQYEKGSVIFKRIDLKLMIEDEPYQAPLSAGIGNLDASEVYDVGTLSGAYYTFLDQSDINVYNNLLIKFQGMYDSGEYEDLVITPVVQDNVERAKIVHTKDNPGVQLKIYYTIVN